MSIASAKLSRSAAGLLTGVALAAAVDAPSTVGAPAPAPAPAPALRLTDLSALLLAAAGGSSADDAEIATLHIGGHDPNRRGFTLQALEVSIAGAVDPWFNAQAHILFLEDAVELEEAFATTTALPHGLEAKAGFFFSEFGRINTRHPHLWAWIDQPVISGRILGGDHSRSVGARIGWLAPTPWYSQVLVGAQNADNETQVSFLGVVDEEDEDVTVGGRPVVDQGGVHDLGDLVWTLRWEHGGEVGDTALKGGLSLMVGPNATGEDGSTRILGVDAAAKWVGPGARQGYPFLLVEVEAMVRDYQADDGVAADDTAIAGDDLTDWGFYAQALWGFRPGWAVGLRVEHATGSGDNVDAADGTIVDRADDPLRSDRTRVSPLVEWRLSHYARLRLQYAYDQADHLVDDDAHTVWLGGEWLIGSHPAHSF